MVKFSQGIGALAVLGLLGACGDRELILEGERIDVRDSLIVESTPEDGADEETPQDQPLISAAITLPSQQTLTDWPQVGGNSAHLPVHHVFGSTPTAVWNSSIGAGENRKYRITATPIVADGRVYTLDSRSQVMAHSTAGAPLWSADLTPASERNQDATGGGLAFGDGMVFVTTGFGQLIALDAASGAQLWVQKANAVMSGAPTYRDGIVYAVSRDNSAWAIRAEDGRVQWQLPGTPSAAGMLGGAAPALSDRLAVFPFGSSDLVATLRKSGIRVWAASVAGQRRGRVYATVSDITGDPVIAGDRIYVSTQSGRTVALAAAGGERIWTAEDGAYSPVLPMGGSVFLVSDESKLVRLDAETGEQVWAVDLPYFVKEKPKKFRSVFAHYGPVMAGGRIVVASDDGMIRFFNPEDGSQISSVEIPGGATTDPVIVNGTMYVVTTKGQLYAFR